MTIFSGVMNLALLVVLIFQVVNVFGDLVQDRAARAGVRKCGLRPFDSGNLINSFLRPHKQNMQEDDHGDNDDSDDGNEDNGDDDVDDNGDYPEYVDKIVGGQRAAHGEFPWQVSVEELVRRSGKVDKYFSCGAVIIGEFWILGAAQCFVGLDASDILLTVGNHHLKRKDTGEQELAVEKIIIHGHYNKEKDIFENDIALLKIKPSANGQGIKFSKHVQPACLPGAKTFFKEGTKCILSGWGQTHKDYPTISDILLKIDSPIVNQQKCKEAYAALGARVTERSICSGNVKGGTGACGGDSGSGLVCKIGNVYTLAGLVSGGVPCALPNYPSLFTLVPKYIPWIKRKIGQYSYSRVQSMLPTAI